MHQVGEIEFYPMVIVLILLTMIIYNVMVTVSFLDFTKPL